MDAFNGEYMYAFDESDPESPCSFPRFPHLCDEVMGSPLSCLYSQSITVNNYNSSGTLISTSNPDVGLRIRSVGSNDFLGMAFTLSYMVNIGSNTQNLPQGFGGTIPCPDAIEPDFSPINKTMELDPGPTFFTAKALPRQQFDILIELTLI
jgi:hypothetical protein